MKDKRLIVGIDVGHSLARPGALSARGEPEHAFNYAMASSLFGLSQRYEAIHLELLEKQDEDLDFKSRAKRAAAIDCQLVISIHHNSLQEEYLEEWTWRGRRLRRSRLASGFCLFVSKANPYYRHSLAFARTVCIELVAGGFLPDVSQARRAGNGLRYPIDAKLGLYEYSTLTILKEVPCAALLIECGVIINDLDEPVLASPQFRDSFGNHVLRGVHICLAAFATEE